jgi:serine/threonine protein kinase
VTELLPESLETFLYGVAGSPAALQPMSPSRALQWMCEAAHIITEVHKKAIVHNDIKAGQNRVDRSMICGSERISSSRQLADLSSSSAVDVCLQPTSFSRRMVNSACVTSDSVCRPTLTTSRMCCIRVCAARRSPSHRAHEHTHIS